MSEWYCGHAASSRESFQPPAFKQEGEWVMSIFRSNRARIAHCAFVVATSFACTQRAKAAQVTYSSLVTTKNPLTYLMLDDPAGSTTAADSGTNGTPTPGTIGSGAA